MKDLDVSNGQKHNFLVADFQQSSLLKEKLDSFVVTQGTIHILVNNTGGPPSGLIQNTKVDEFLRAFNNHLAWNHILVRALIEGMKEAYEKAGFKEVIRRSSTRPIMRYLI